MNVLFIGAASQAKLCQHILERQGHHVSHVYDAKPDVNLPGKNFKSSDDADVEHFAKVADTFMVCIGGARGHTRTLWSKRLALLMPAISAISPATFLGDTVVYGRGLQAMPHAVVNQFSIIGDWCILNTNCTVDHECIIGDGVHIMGGASLAGKITVGNYSTIGTNATILPNITIGSNAFIGAGSVVTKYVPDNAVVAGVPAQVLRLNDPVKAA